MRMDSGWWYAMGAFKAAKATLAAWLQCQYLVTMPKSRKSEFGLNFLVS
jgi:hypothetical protein